MPSVRVTPSKVTATVPSALLVVLTLPSVARSSSAESRLSSRSFGVSPTAVAAAIAVLRPWIVAVSLLTCATVSWTFCWVWLWRVVSWLETSLKPLASVEAASTSDWRAAMSDGSSLTFCQADQYAGEHRVQAGGRGLVDHRLDLPKPVLACLRRALEHRLSAKLDIQERVPHAREPGHGHAGAELHAR